VVVNRLPDVKILTADWYGVPALASSYAKERGPVLTAIPLDFSVHRGVAAE
jgi:hypothetical protein